MSAFEEIYTGKIMWQFRYTVAVVLFCLIAARLIAQEELPPPEPVPAGQAIAPNPGFCFPVELIRVKDGDTIQVEVKVTLDIRLKDCWAPERNSPGGKESTESLRKLVGGKDLRLFIPSKGRGRLGDILTLNRPLAFVYAGHKDNWVNVNEAQIELGHATLRKKKK